MKLPRHASALTDKGELCVRVDADEHCDRDTFALYSWRRGAALELENRFVRKKKEENDGFSSSFHLEHY